MSKSLRKDLYIILLFLLSSVILEVVTFSFLGFGFSPKYIGFIIAFWVFFSMFILIFPNILKIIFCIIILLLQTIIGGVNASLYYVNGDIFYLETIKQAKAGIHVATSDVFDIKCIVVLAIILIIAVIGFILIVLGIVLVAILVFVFVNPKPKYEKICDNGNGSGNGCFRRHNSNGGRT